MNPKPSAELWRGIDPQEAEARARHLRDLIASADQAIEAQERIIATEGSHFAFDAALRSLVDERRALERDLLNLLSRRTREEFLFALDGARYRNHTAPAGALAGVLAALTGLYTRVCQSAERITRNIPPHLARLCELEVAGFFESSFGIQFTISSESDMAGTSPTLRGLEDTFRLMNAEEPADVAASYGPWAIKQYRQLIVRLRHAEATPVMHWTTPFGDIQQWKPDVNRLLLIEHRLARLRAGEVRTREAEGVLLEASLIRHTFGLAGPEGTVKGKIPRELGPKVAACFNQRCRAVFEERRVLDEATEQEKKSVMLLDIIPLATENQLQKRES